MGDLLAKSEITAKVEKGAVASNITGQINKDGIVGLQNGAVKNTLESGGKTAIQDGGVTATVKEGAVQACGIQYGGVVGAAEGAFGTTGVEKGGLIGLQEGAIKAVFQSNGAVAVAIVSVIAMMIIGGVIISYTFIVSLAFLLVLVALVYMYLDKQKKVEELYMKVKDEAWKHLECDKSNVEIMLNKIKTQFSAEITSVESDWPVQTQSTMMLKEELQKLHREICNLSLNISDESSAHRRSIYACKSGEWDHVISFRKIQEDAIKQCDKKKDEISVLKKKFNLTDSTVLAETTRQVAEGMGNVLPNEENDLRLYKLPLQLTNSHKKIRRFELGKDEGKNHRYVMIVGMTGAGKSLLINNIINYIYGVEYTDNFRFKLIVEDEEINERGEGASTSQALSMTSWVSAFTLHHQKGFRIPFSITLIDTPGFGDTRGFAYDEEIVTQIKEYFTNDSICQSSEITCIGLVMQSSQARITAEQKYIVDQVLQLFAKDIEDNIFLFFTFADGQPPPVLKVVKEEKIPFAEGRFFKFNNSALYAEDAEFFWDFGFKNLKAFFDALLVTQSISLKLTKQNLEEREHLRIALENLRPQIEKGMAQLEKIRAQTEMLKKVKGDIQLSKNYKMTTTVQKEVAVAVHHSITNCNACRHTCHDPCGIVGDMKEGCAAISNGYCKFCTGKCHWDKHTNGWHKYELKAITETTTVQQLFNKYNVSVKDKDAKKKILVELINEYGGMKMVVFDLIQKANDCSNKLDEISLRPNYLNNVQYIERLIDSEQKKTKGFAHRAQRLKQLRNMKDLALLLQDVRTSPDVLTNKVNEMEVEIQTIILETLDGIEDDEDYKDAKTQSKKTVGGTIKNWCKKAWGAISY